jgi:DNA-binding NarL/FixJ family response regulator
VVLMDVRMPRRDGIEATALIVGADGPRVLILTTFDLDDYVYAALRAGASGFLLKDAEAEQLIEAIRVVNRGDMLLAPSVTRLLVDEVLRAGAQTKTTIPGIDELTDRETDVLVLIAKGLSNAEIAERLYLGEATVKTHVGRILAKLGLRDRVQVVVAAYEAGLVTRLIPQADENRCASRFTVRHDCCDPARIPHPHHRHCCRRRRRRHEGVRPRRQ